MGLALTIHSVPVEMETTEGNTDEQNRAHAYSSLAKEGPLQIVLVLPQIPTRT